MPCTPSRCLMPNYRRQFQPGGTFFFTVVTAQRRNLFSDDVTRGHLRNAITTVQAEQPFDIVAIVLLPNHIHCIWTLPENDSDFSHGKIGSAESGRNASGNIAFAMRMI